MIFFYRCVVMLLKWGVDFNLLVNGLSVFYVVVGLDFFFNFCFICFLLDYGGNFNVFFIEGLIFIYVVIMWEWINCFKILFNCGGNYDWLENKEKNVLWWVKVFKVKIGVNIFDCFLKKFDEWIYK